MKDTPYTEQELSDINAIVGLKKDLSKYNEVLDGIISPVVWINTAWIKPTVHRINVTKETTDIIIIEFDFFGPKCAYRGEYNEKRLLQAAREKKCEIIV